MHVQLNKCQTDLYLLELSHQMTNVCLLISDFLLVFDCSFMLETLNCSAHLKIKANTIQKSTNNFMSNHG